MSRTLSDVLLVLRRAADLTQEELASRLGIAQAALSRYENDMRDPEPEIREKLAQAFGVTSDFLSHEFRMQGAIAADAHMRKQRTAKPTDWKRVEARLNALRMQSSYLLDRVPLRPQNDMIQADPAERSPDEAAAMLRAAWRMPIGPVRNLMRWVESAGVIVAEEDFGTHRIDGMSQWAGDHAVMVLNSGLPTDRKRMTVAHELGHLVLHGTYVDVDLEEQAAAFAAEFLMPAAVIAPELTRLTLGKLSDLKIEWGVSMQGLFERAYRMGKTGANERQMFYRRMNSRGWRIREPESDALPSEVPELALSVGRRLGDSGLPRREVLRLIGVREGTPTPFIASSRMLHAV